MAFAAGVVIAVDILVEFERRREQRLLRRHLRDIQNPFDISEVEFVKNYRLNQESVLSILETINPYLNHGHRRTKIPSHLRFLSALNFFATGSYQRNIANSFLSTSSQPMISRSIKEICNVLLRRCLFQWIKFPQNHAHRQYKKDMFVRLHRLQHVIGIIDGTHIAIVPPAENEHVYVNRKGYHSLNVQIICDAECKILNIVAMHPGSNHDAFIWRTCRINSIMRANYENGDQETRIIGDSGYPCQPWLLVPLPNPRAGAEQLFNNTFKSARSTVERCIGLFKGRFRCLLKDRTLHYRPENAARIVMACAILHNVAIHFRIPDVELDRDEIDALEPENPPQPDQIYRQLGQQARTDYINQYFN